MQEVVYSVIKQELADKFYLDFDSRRIDWEAWLNLYNKTCVCRQARLAPMLDDSKLARPAEILLSMIETFSVHMATESTYVGNVELQLALHALILIRFEPNGGRNSLGDTIRPMIEEILSYHEKVIPSRAQFDTLSAIISKLYTRFKHMQTPVIDGKLVYPPGKIMGIHSVTNW